MVDSPTPFEGPEKLLEVWFAACPADIAIVEKESHRQINGDKKIGLRCIPGKVWQDMLDIVKCKILNVVHGEEIDAYLLSESSLFIFPHKLILKTCGRTLNLLGLPRILSIASEHASLDNVYQLFYSRKSFMFPEHQSGPHTDWGAEVRFLDDLFEERSTGIGDNYWKNKGSAYTIGRVNGDHWLLYVVAPPPLSPPPPPDSPEEPIIVHTPTTPTLPTLDCTLEVLMTELSPRAAEPFFFSSNEGDMDPIKTALDLSTRIGISDLLPTHLTTLDAYAFDPCGYSANALISCPAKGGEEVEEKGEEGYYTIHVTPEQGYSYASFECNIALPTSTSNVNSKISADELPDLTTLIRRVVSIFQPGRITLTVFMSALANREDEETGDSEIEAAQKAFLRALKGKTICEVGGYKRTDKINYELGCYDLAFATFERFPKV